MDRLIYDCSDWRDNLGIAPLEAINRLRRHDNVPAGSARLKDYGWDSSDGAPVRDDMQPPKALDLARLRAAVATSDVRCMDLANVAPGY